ncbi:restriction endonuclease subunit S [Staphylococcus equorum]|uniref:restriction endonuclease subunit S n=1 Tax=Staphylococcus equorum TaxID=246432 RepID=UPI000D1C9832|nr:restriction endonuclease subunit S [Staphylococcus equorum]PTE42183.1 restriction endonuclease subunit S [Staphylococcus equorum]
MTNQEKKVPELRFPEFDGEWEEKTIGKIATTFSGGTPSSTNRSYYNGEIPFIRSGEISKSSTELMINKEAISNSSAKMVEKGDLLYALYGATSGEVAISKISGAINQAVLCIRSQESATYIFNYLKMKKDQILKTYIQGGQGNLSASIIKKVDINLPYIEEQEKIGTFFSKLDRQIELEEQKLAKLEEQKKGYMQQIFSQQLRFKDENGDYYSEWKEKLIKDILEFENNRRKPITSSLREIGKYPYYGATGIIDYVKDYIFDGETRLLIGEDGAKWGAFEESSFIAKNRYWVNNHAHVCKSKINNLFFLNYLLNYKELRTYVTGNAPAKLTYNNLSMIPMFLPSVYEQEKIGNFLKKIDELIGKQNKKINELKIRKQGFLQKMFI